MKNGALSNQVYNLIIVKNKYLIFVEIENVKILK